MAILTGLEIKKQVSQKRIVIDPFRPEKIGGNSIDFHLHEELKVYTDNCLNLKEEPETEKKIIPKEGLVLFPGKLYLGRTVEYLESEVFVPFIEGRSSVARLGIQVHSTAPMAQIGFKGTFTLEISVIQPVRVFANFPVCQIFFFSTLGEVVPYKSRYHGQIEATAYKSK